jgi:hypothetical protein
MSEPRNLRCYDYVNRPYPAVRKLFTERALDIFRRGTTSAAQRSKAVAASLHASFAGIDISVDIDVEVQGMREEEGVAGLSPVTRITLSWEAERGAALFPIMNAELSFWPLPSGETQLELEGAYRPPLGLLGSALDAAVGHRIAEAAVHRFLHDVIEQVRVDVGEDERRSPRSINA